MNKSRQIFRSNHNSLSAGITIGKTKVRLSEARFLRSRDRQPGSVFGCHVIPVFDENRDATHTNFINEGIMRWFQYDLKSWLITVSCCFERVCRVSKCQTWTLLW